MLNSYLLTCYGGFAFRRGLCWPCKCWLNIENLLNFAIRRSCSGKYLQKGHELTYYKRSIKNQEHNSENGPGVTARVTRRSRVASHEECKTVRGICNEVCTSELQR